MPTRLNTSSKSGGTEPRPLRTCSMCGGGEGSEGGMLIAAPARGRGHTVLPCMPRLDAGEPAGRCKRTMKSATAAMRRADTALMDEKRGKRKPASSSATLLMQASVSAATRKTSSLREAGGAQGERGM